MLKIQFINLHVAFFALNYFVKSIFELLYFNKILKPFLKLSQKIRHFKENLKENLMKQKICY